MSQGSQVGKNEDATGSAASHVAAQIDAALTRELQWAAARGMSPSRAKKIQALLKRGDKHAEERQQQGSRWKSKHQIAHVDKVNDCVWSVKSADALGSPHAACFQHVFRSHNLLLRLAVH